MWLGASPASSPGSARLVVLALFAPPLCPSSPPPLRAPSHDQQRRYSSGGEALALRPACQDGLDCACAPHSPHLSTPLTLPAPPPAPRSPPRRTQADFPTQDDDLRVAVERLRAGCGCCLRQVVFASRVCRPRRPRRPRRARRPLPYGHGHCAAERRHVDHKGI